MKEKKEKLSIDERFDCQEILGEGAFAIVYRAFDCKKEKLVALKVLKDQAGQHLKRFRREGELLSSLHHRNIIEIYDMQLDRQPAFISMELLKGQPLDRILNHGPLPISKAVSIARQLASTLAHLHKRSVYHRDVKPENIIVEVNRVVLMDFNLALPTDGTMLTATGELLGTPRYIAPEIWKGAPARENADTYALGMVLYEMVAGREISFNAPIPGAKEWQKLPAPSQYNEEVPQQLDVLISRAIAPDPKKRFRNCSALENALKSGFTREKRTKQKAEAKTPQNKPKKKWPLLILLLLFSTLLYFHVHMSKHSVRDNLAIEFCPLSSGFFCQFPKSGFKDSPHWELWQEKELLYQGNCQKKGNNFFAQATEIESSVVELTFRLLSSGKTVYERKFIRPKSNLATPFSCRLGQRFIEISCKLHGPAAIEYSLHWLSIEKKETLRSRKENLRVRAPKGGKNCHIKCKVGSFLLAEETVQLTLATKVSNTSFGFFSHSSAIVTEGSFLCIPNDVNDIYCYRAVPSSKGTTLEMAWSASFGPLTPCRHVRLIADDKGGAFVLTKRKGFINVLRMDIRKRLTMEIQPELGTLHTEWTTALSANHPLQTKLIPTNEGSLYVFAANTEGQLQLLKLKKGGKVSKLELGQPKPLAIIAATLWDKKLTALTYSGNKLQLRSWADKPRLQVIGEHIRHKKLTRLFPLSPKTLLLQKDENLSLINQKSGTKLEVESLPALPETKSWEVAKPMLGSEQRLAFIYVRSGISAKGKRKEKAKEDFQIAGEVVQLTYDLSQKPTEVKSRLLGRAVIFNDRTLRVYRRASTDKFFIQPAFESVYVFTKKELNLVDKIQLFQSNSDVFTLSGALLLGPNQYGIRILDLVDY